MRGAKSQGKFYTFSHNVREDSIAGAFKQFDETLAETPDAVPTKLSDLENRYTDFCRYRHEIGTNRMPNRGGALFTKRVFEGGAFVLSSNDCWRDY
jgi:hypothetical protein